MTLPEFPKTGSFTIVGTVTVYFVSPTFRQMCNLKAACACPIKAIGDRYVRLLIEEHRRDR